MAYGHKVPCLLLSLAVVIIFYSDVTRSVMVVKFQEDGIARLDTVGYYKPPIDRNKKISSVTLCARFKIFYLHGRDTFFNLRDNVTNSWYMIKGEIWLERLRPAFAARWNYMMLKNKLETLTWYHTCFIFDDTQKKYITYVNGEFEYELPYDLKRQIFGDFAMIGQGGELSESFSGELSQVNIWDRVISAEQVKKMADCQSDPQGNYISWNAGWEIFNADVADVDLSHFCQQEVGSVYFWFPDLPPASSNYICESLGTHLPLPKTAAEAETWLERSRNLWGTETRCSMELVVPINDVAEDGVWTRLYDGEVMNHSQVAWKDGEPNGIVYENCAQIELEGIADIDCLTRVQCAVCEFTRRQVFSLRGTCELELRNINFLAYQEELGDILFKGYGEYQIARDNGTWVWSNVVGNYVIATMVTNEPNYPMGRRLWDLKRPICNQKEGTRMLLLTPCPENEYSCDDATCIPRELRCDLKYDCVDRSDEAECEMVVFPKDYKNDLPPRGNGKSLDTRLPVSLQINLETLNVDTTQMTMMLTYRLTLVWLDNRLQYLNMKVNDSLNKLPYTTMTELWSPIVGYVNTEGNQHTYVDIEASMHALRRSSPAYVDDSAPAEVDVFPGSKNPLRISRKYSTVFVCDFKLILYPFDEQYCDLHFRILSASQNYLFFDIQSALAEYEGGTLLIEYEVGRPIVQAVNSKEFSEMKVRIPLKRQYGYAILNIYTPSLILITISYVTLFFRPRIFEVRVMTALTSLLVVATLFTQVSSSLPKTSYFKMVDIWLLFCIGMIFFIIVFHAIIDNYLPDSDSMDILSSKDSGKSFFKRVAPVGDTKAVDLDEIDDRTKRVQRVRKLILASKVISLLILVIFNVFYWSFILG